MSKFFWLVAVTFLTAVLPACAAERPNIVWIVSEDNTRLFLKMYDPGGVATPNIEALAADGLTFEHAFSNAPVCSVARTTLATGIYAPRLATQYHRRAELVTMPRNVRLFTAYLRDAGYYTANNQKKDYNVVEPSDSWHASSNKATWRNRAPDQPFFYMQSIHTTHEGSLHFNKNQMANRPTQNDPANVKLWPQHPDTPTFRYTYARYLDLHQQMDKQVGQIVEQLRADGLLEDTFIFYFGDHGGVLPGSKGYAHEVGLHVPLVVRIPENFKHLVDGERGDHVDGFVSFIDFGPTVLHLAGAAVPESMDGQPFLGADIAMDAVNQRDEAFGYADRFDEKYDLVRTYRKGDYKYVRNFQPFNLDGLFNQYRFRMLAFKEWKQMHRAGELNPAQAQFFEARPPEALYDLAVDPFETNNLADDPAYAAVLTEMRAGLTDWVKTMPDLSMYPEPVMVERAVKSPVGFGQKFESKIAAMVDVANLQLEPFNAEAIGNALASEDPWTRYWGLIVCSTFGEEAAELVEPAKRIAMNRREQPMVRARAAEFLALADAGDPVPILQSALDASDDPLEALLILNTATMLKDSQTASMTDLKVPERFLDMAWVKHRANYLSQ